MNGDGIAAFLQSHTGISATGVITFNGGHAEITNSTVSATMSGGGQSDALSNNDPGSAIKVTSSQLTVSEPAIVAGTNQPDITFNGSNTCTVNGDVMACP